MVRPADSARPLADVLDHLERARRDNHDHHVNLRHLRFVVATELPGAVHDQLTLQCDAPGVPGPIHLREAAMPRLLRFLGVPSGFGQALPAAMVAANLNYLLRARADELVLLRLRRADDHTVLRAMLPASHVRVDDTALLGRLLRLPGARELRVAGAEIGEDRFHLRAIRPRSVNVGRDGQDPVHPGLDLYNSETGAGSLGIVQCLFRVVCANGILLRQGAGSARRWRHAHHDGDRLRSELAEALRRAAADTGRLADRYRQLHHEPLEEPAARLDAFMQRHRLGSVRGRTGERILTELNRTGDLFGSRSLFDFVQAVTAVARTLEVEKRRRFEAAAGELLRIDH
jgi:hypothetical protein